MVREAWRQAWAGGPSQESSSIAEQWFLKGGGLIQVDRDDAAGARASGARDGVCMGAYGRRPKSMGGSSKGQGAARARKQSPRPKALQGRGSSSARARRKHAGEPRPAQGGPKWRAVQQRKGSPSEYLDG